MNCQCRRCMQKIPSDGFHRASKFDYARDAAVRDELDYWMESRTGYNPRADNPMLDSTAERPRNIASLKAFLANTRKKFPRAFGKRVAAFSGEHEVLEFKPSDPKVLQEMRDKIREKLADTTQQDERQ